MKSLPVFFLILGLLHSGCDNSSAPNNDADDLQDAETETDADTPTEGDSDTQPDGDTDPVRPECSTETSANLRSCVEGDRYQSMLETLAVVRLPGSDNWQMAQDLCADELDSLGFDVERHTYATGVNVIGTLEGQSQTQVFLSAHYDHIESCEGADDNASGVAGVLEAARVLSMTQYEKTLVIACWDEEERGLVGSRAYATEADARGDEIEVSVVYEMIGYYSDQPNSQLLPTGFETIFPDQVKAIEENERRGDFIAIIADLDASPTYDAFEVHAQNIGLKTQILSLSLALMLNPLASDLRRSDHAAFWEQTYPAIMVTDTANFRNENYHCVGGPDSVDRLDQTFATRIIEATVGSVADVLVISE